MGMIRLLSKLTSVRNVIKKTKKTNLEETAQSGLC